MPGPAERLEGPIEVAEQPPGETLERHLPRADSVDPRRRDVAPELRIARGGAPEHDLAAEVAQPALDATHQPLDLGGQLGRRFYRSVEFQDPSVLGEPRIRD